MKVEYLPLIYLQKVKRPGENYFLNQIFLDDFLLLVLAISWLSPRILTNSLSLLLLTISLTCVYETGYWENDQIGEKYEREPILSESYASYDRFNFFWQPWAWSFFLALPALFFLQVSQLPISEIDNSFLLADRHFFYEALKNSFYWFCLLVVTRIAFWIYNHINPEARVWLFPILQSAKCFGFLVVTKTNLVGYFLFTAQVLSRWLPYLIYRHGGERKSFPKRMARFFIFIFLSLWIVVSESYFLDILLSYKYQIAIILVTIGLRAFREIKQLVSATKFITQVQKNKE